MIIMKNNSTIEFKKCSMLINNAHQKTEDNGKTEDDNNQKNMKQSEDK